MAHLCQKIDHIGIAVTSLEEAVQIYQTLTGIKASHFEEVPDQKVKTAFLKVGVSHIELLETTDPNGPIGRFIRKQGRGGVHHICLSVSNIVEALNDLEKAGFQLVDRKPRQGARNKLVAFVHPKSTDGVLIELSQDKP